MSKVNFDDFIGHRFGILEIISKAPNTRFGQMAVVRCDCGNEKIYPLTSLRINRYKSCGCLLEKRRAVGNIIHGFSSHPLYRVLASMKVRCYDTNDHSYPDYGAKGVIICDEWLKDPSSFVVWGLKNGWEKGLQIDKDILGDGLLYSPETCCFVTSLENQNERSCTKLIEMDGEMYTYGEICRIYNIAYDAFSQRIKRGWDIKRAINEKVKSNGRPPTPLNKGLSRLSRHHNT